MALTALVRDLGDVEKTASRLIADEFMVSADVLALWKTETHVEQYKRIEEHLGHEIERDAIMTAQHTIRRGGELRLALLERVGKIERQELVSQALRAVSDATRKATTELMLLTGRPIDGASNDASVEAMTRLVTGLQELGLVKVAPQIAVALDGDDVIEEPTG